MMSFGDDNFSDDYLASSETSISCIIWPQDEVGGLYLGSMKGARNVKELKTKNITAVLTVAAKSYLVYEKEDIPNHLIIEADDEADYDLSQHFDTALEFIGKHLETGNVFVHCFAGVSRSATVVIAYLLKEWRKSLTEVTKYVKQKRGVASPNRGFYKQLMEFEKKLQSERKK